MAGLSYSGLVTQIRNYTEVDSNVLTADQLENIILVHKNCQLYLIFTQQAIVAQKRKMIYY